VDTVIDFDVDGWNMPELPAAEQVIPGQQISAPMMERLNTYPSRPWQGYLGRVRDERLQAFRTAHGLNRRSALLPTVCYHSLIGQPKEFGCVPGSSCVGNYDVLVQAKPEFFRIAGPVTRGRVDVCTFQTFATPTALLDVQKMSLYGATYGLETWLAPRQSWHVPGVMTLIVVARPGTISLLDGDQSPSFLAALA